MAKKPTRVVALKLNDRPNYVLRWRDADRKLHQEATETTNRRAADRLAANKELELEEAHANRIRVPWADFRQRVLNEKYSCARKSTRDSWDTVANWMENLIDPKDLWDLDADRVSKFAGLLAAEGLATDSIACYLRTLRAVLRWAGRTITDYTAPAVSVPRTAKRKAMKGRPITLEEFERMLANTAAEVGEEDERRWKRYLRGLWVSGLRLSESLILSWDGNATISIRDIDSRFPMIAIAAESEKGNQDRLWPMPPDLAEFLRRYPQRLRHGRVFRLRVHGRRVQCKDRVGRVVSAIGKQAGVIVDSRAKEGETVVKYASAHDLRRSFAARWAEKLMPSVLRELMRHESIETTMKYYVGQNAMRTAATIWATHADDKSGDKKPGRKKTTRRKSNNS